MSYKSPFVQPRKTFRDIGKSYIDSFCDDSQKSEDLSLITFSSSSLSCNAIARHAYNQYTFGKTLTICPF